MAATLIVQMVPIQNFIIVVCLIVILIIVILDIVIFYKQNLYAMKKKL